MTEDIPKDVCELLKKTFGEPSDNFEVDLHEGNKKGEGFLGDISFISLKSKKTNNEYHLAIKQVLPSERESTRKLMTVSFLNESLIYTKVLPKLQDFQKSFPKAQIFDNFPKCYGTSNEDGKQKIILENLKFKNYEVHPKTVPVPFKMYKKIFQLYGKYHALSFAFKELRPKEFMDLASSLQNYWITLLDSGLLNLGIQHCTQKIGKMLGERGETKLMKKFQRYVDEGDVIFRNLNQYKDPYGVIIHGDSWSNNLMFKFSESREVEDIKLLDFQVSFLGSPVFDLTYTLYSGADEACLNNLDELLEIYHESLSENLKHYDLDVERIYSFDVFKTEWKKYSPYGFIAAMLVWRPKTMEEDEVISLNEALDNKLTTSKPRRKEDVYNGILHYLIKHMCERGFF